MATLPAKGPKMRSHKKKIPMVLPATDFTPKLTGKPATILYKKLPDDMILITGFENFLNLDEIFDKYGRVIAKAYSDYSYHMTSSIGAVFLSGMEPKYISHVAIGQLFNKHDFSMLIAHVKKCGGLLHDIILAVNGGEVKRIEI